MLGYKTDGHGAEKVIVLHDWFSDTTSYDSIRPYLPIDRFTFAFVDLRGYGRSKAVQGTCSLYEAVDDVLMLADHLKWPQFNLIGHSMSGQIVQYLMASQPDRVHKTIAITPVPASGSPVPEDVFSFIEDAARQNDDSALQIVHMMTGHRYTDTFCQRKVHHWRGCAHEEARVAYLHMFAETDVSDVVKNCQRPLHVIAGEYDAPAHSRAVMEQTVLQWFPNATLTELDCGHYPMEETPVALAAEIERFL